MGSTEPDPNVRALDSIDAVHDADPELLNEPVARLRRFVRFRRPLYYSVLAPVSAISRISPLVVLVSGGAALVATVVALLGAWPPLVILALMYWSVAALAYHALSVRLAALMDDAAASVGLGGDDVLSRWGG